MAYNFKNLADVELLGAMPENANVLVEVDGATKRAPKENFAAVEALEEVPEGATVLAEVGGEIKRVPGAGLGGETNTFVATVVDGVCTTNMTFDEVAELFDSRKLNLGNMAVYNTDGYIECCFPAGLSIYEDMMWFGFKDFNGNQSYVGLAANGGIEYEPPGNPS